MVGTKAEFLLKWMVSDHPAANCLCVCLENPCSKTLNESFELVRTASLQMFPDAEVHTSQVHWKFSC